MGHEVNIEAIVKEKADTSDSSRKNKVILIQNGSESSSNKWLKSTPFFDYIIFCFVLIKFINHIWVDFLS